MLSRTSPYALWALLALLPALWTWQALTSTDPRIVHILVHPTGEFAARLLIVTLMVTPLAMLFKGTGFARWLKKSRRHFGVAAFGYAALHTLFYVLDKASLGSLLADLPKLWIWTGWAAFAIFLPLAVTSTDGFVRRLGPAWKQLQRWTYAAALLTLVHWAALHDWEHPTAALVHFAPLAALELYRLWYWTLRRRPAAAA